MTLTIDISEERARALEARAQERGVTAERYVEQVVEQDLKTDNVQSISEMMREVWADMPAEVRARMPRDGASQIDHYVYGLPRRDL